MEDLTLPQAAKKLEKYIMTLPGAKQFNMLSSAPRKAMLDLQDTAHALRSNTDRYFHADDSGDQKLYLAAAVEQVKLLDSHIMSASTHDLLGPADVAILGALNSHIQDRLG